MSQMQFPFVERKLVAINNRTCYDVPTKVKMLARDIENGKYGNVTDVVICIRQKEEKEYSFDCCHYGTSCIDTAIATVERCKTHMLTYGR